VHDAVARDDHVVGRHGNTVERGNQKLDQNAVRVAHVENGRVTAFWSFVEGSVRD
jgi:ketosteroid isomerase-like protein